MQWKLCKINVKCDDCVTVHGHSSSFSEECSRLYPITLRPKGSCSWTIFACQLSTIRFDLAVLAQGESCASLQIGRE